jgi:hypothetical protein
MMTLQLQIKNKSNNNQSLKDPHNKIKTKNNLKIQIVKQVLTMIQLKKF